MLGASRLTRRDAAKLLGVGTGATVLGGRFSLSARSALAQTPSPSSYEGITLRGMGLAGAAWNPAVEQFAREFEEATGAKVEWDFQPWEQTMPKLQADLAAGTAQYDFFCNDIEFQYTIYP